MRDLYPIFVGACLVSASGQANAGGQYVGDVGTQSLQRAGAFVAKADDPSAIFFNPAGIARAKTKQFQLGASLVSLNLSFDRFGEYENGDPFPEVQNQGGPQPIPYFGIVWPLKNFVIAGGLFTPCLLYTSPSPRDS